MVIHQSFILKVVSLKKKKNSGSSSADTQGLRTNGIFLFLVVPFDFVVHLGCGISWTTVCFTDFYVLLIFNFHTLP